MKAAHAEGFPPVYNERSELLILGSFPSVKSRAVQFYYGNAQNRFWHTVCGFFSENVPETVAGKKEFLLRRHIALWDVVESCDIVGSSDASIQNVKIADIALLLQNAPIRAIFCNGGKSHELFVKYFPAYADKARRLSSTSPANPRFSVEEWRSALGEIFCT